jgi:hypothetical protein
MSNGPRDTERTRHLIYWHCQQRLRGVRRSFGRCLVATGTRQNASPWPVHTLVDRSQLRGGRAVVGSAACFSPLVNLLPSRVAVVSVTILGEIASVEPNAAT